MKKTLAQARGAASVPHRRTVHAQEREVGAGPVRRGCISRSRRVTGPSYRAGPSTPIRAQTPSTAEITSSTSTVPMVVISTVSRARFSEAL